MSSVNEHVLREIENYRRTVDKETGDFFNYVSSREGINLFGTNHIKLYSLITENVKMDLNYLLSVNPDYDIFGFPGAKRNIRNSIEAYYDLINLTADPDYLSILKYISSNSHTDENDLAYVQEKADLYGLRKGNNVSSIIINIKEKAEIAKVNGLVDWIFELLKKNSVEANSYVHPDIFITPPDDKSLELEELLHVDCLLLAGAFWSLKDFVKDTFELTYQYDAFEEYRKLTSSLEKYKNSYII